MERTAVEIREIFDSKLPKDSVVAEHTEEAHFYRYQPNGKLYPSVTTKTSILDAPHLKSWMTHLTTEYIKRCWDMITPENRDQIFFEAEREHENILNDAGGIGTVGHNAIEYYIHQWIATGVQPEKITDFIEPSCTDIRATAICRSAQKFMKDFDFSPIMTERKIVSVEHEYAGTLDCLGFIKVRGKEVFALIDWKTSNYINKPEYAMQTAAYYNALVEMTGLKPSVIVVVRLDKKQAKYEVRELKDPQNAFKAFKNAISLYDWLEDGYDKLLPVEPKKVTSLLG
jgi:hypothetical protein